MRIQLTVGNGGSLGRSEKLLARCLDQLDRIDDILDAPVPVLPFEMAMEFLERVKRILSE